MTAVPGSVRIAPRALQRAARAAAAEVVEATPAEVRADVVERGAVLDVHVAAPVRIGPQSVVAAARSQQQRIVERVAQVTGARMGRCRLQVTGVRVASVPRVR